MNWSDYREQELPFLREAAYLDYALRGLVSRRAVSAAQHALDSSAEGRAARERQAAALDGLRASLRSLAGWQRPDGRQAEPPLVGDVCLTANTTTAIALLAGSVSWRKGERILLHADEVASNRRPWEAVARQHDLEVVTLPSRDGRLVLEDLAQACREPVAWASFAALCLDTGERRPIAQIRELVSAAGGKLCVDAAQAAGSIPLEGADAIAGSGRKWLCGPPEVGFLLIADAAAAELLPLSAGGCSGPGARALEGGVPPLVPAAGLGASLEAFAALGWDEVLSQIQERSERVRQLGAEAGWALAFPHSEAEQGPIVHFKLPDGAPSDLEARLEARGVFARVTSRRTLRVSAHAWTASAEIERLIREVDSLCS